MQTRYSKEFKEQALSKVFPLCQNSCRLKKFPE
jgi:hypothetical protein